MFDLYCLTCTNLLILQVEVKNMLAYYSLKFDKNILKPHITELVAENPKIEVNTFFCLNCGKPKETNEVAMKCRISGEMISVNDIELIEVKGDIKDIFPIKKNKYNNEELVKKLFRSPKDLNIEIFRLPAFILKKEI